MGAICSLLYRACVCSICIHERTCFGDWHVRAKVSGADLERSSPSRGGFQQAAPCSGLQRGRKKHGAAPTGASALKDSHTPKLISNKFM